MLVDWYLRLLNRNRAMALQLDWGPVHIHVVGRAVFFLWVSVAILAVAGIAVAISRKRELGRV